MAKTSEISKFYKKGHEERLQELKELAGLGEEELGLYRHQSALPFELADKMIENVIGIMPMPLGIATHFKVNGKDYLVPMAIEEASVVAAASNAAKLARVKGGFTAKADESLMVAQVQIVKLKNPEKAKKAVMKNKKVLLELANKANPTLQLYGGGAKSIEPRVIKTKRGKMLIVHLMVDVKDAMGANAVNTMAEGMSRKLEEITAGKILLRIVSNLAVHRLVKAKAVWDKNALAESTGELKMKPEQVVDAILDAWAFGEADQFRGTTHNKGIMNGIDAVVIATGNDFRAVESGAHSYAAYGRKYTTLTKYSKDKQGNLVGEIELPMAIGLVGGATKSHPVARANVKLLGIKTAKELAEVLAAVGLAQNFAALRALATEGIQKGHMRLHSKNVAIAAGAKGEMIEIIAGKMVEEKQISPERAAELLKEMG